jgi:hypothetical protein
LAATPEPGRGVWLSGGGSDEFKAINAYNSEAPMGQKVRYLFVKAGQWVLDGGRSHWDLDLDQAVIAADSQSGDSYIYLWIDGTSQGAESMSAQDWERMATDMEGILQSKRLGGLYLAPRCCGRALYPLYAALRRHLDLPLSVEVGADEPTAFPYADFLVLRPVPASGDEATYKGMTQDLTAAFVTSAQDAGAKILVGVSGLGAKDPERWYADAILGLKLSLPLQGDSFMGVAVWGLVADDEGVMSALAPAIWRQMEIPITPLVPEAWHQMQDSQGHP